MGNKSMAMARYVIRKETFFFFLGIDNFGNK